MSLPDKICRFSAILGGSNLSRIWSKTAPYLAGALAKYGAVLLPILLRFDHPKMAQSLQILSGSDTKMLVFYYLFCLKTGHLDLEKSATQIITTEAPGHFEGSPKIDLQGTCPSQSVPERESFGGGPCPFDANKYGKNNGYREYHWGEVPLTRQIRWWVTLLWTT